jgi:glycosyltransferase involved in cell wall biosynthesis
MWNLHKRLLECAETQFEGPVCYFVSDYWPTLPSACEQHWQGPARNPVFSAVKDLLATVLGTRRENMCLDYAPRLEWLACVSAFVRDRLIEQDSVHVDARIIHNGIDVELLRGVFQKREMREAFRCSGVSVGYVGRIVPEKGIDTVIRSAAVVMKSRSAQLHLYGDGPQPYLSLLHELCAELGISDLVRFHGWVPHERLPEILLGLDIALYLPVWDEPLSLSIQECMASGLPVIATRVGGTPELVSEPGGLILVNVGDYHEVSQRIAELTVSYDHLKAVSRASAETARAHFSIERMYEDLRGFLCVALEDHQTRRYCPREDREP